MTAALYEQAPPVPALSREPTPAEPVGIAISDILREHIWHGWATAPRSVQRSLGMSEIGTDCPRQIAYKLTGTTPINHDGEPMPSLVGTAVHASLASMFTRLDGGSGRYLVETPVSYRGIGGSVDLLDRRKKLVIDWKVTRAAKLRKIRAEGPPFRYVSQIHGYGAGLASVGEPVERVAIVYIPHDGKLADLWTWTAPLDESIPDKAIARVEDVRARLAACQNDPSEVVTEPSRLCGWCPFHAPNATNPRVACRGAAQK